MSNMSYCRFRNTTSDLDDCVTALEEMAQGSAGKLSREELQAAYNLANSAARLLELLAETGDLSLDGGDLDELTDVDWEQAINEVQECADADIDP